MSQASLLTARCWGDGDPLMAAYHDEEWGRPVRTEQGLFEKVCLEAFQAGLSWRTVLVRREGLRAAFAGFDADACAQLDEADLERLLAAPGMLRNRAKVLAVGTNARATLALRDTGGLVDLVWSHAPPAGPAPASLADVPAVTPESTALAKALRRSGFTFVGPTTCYALMQADGLVDDHLATCPVREEVEAAGSAG